MKWKRPGKPSVKTGPRGLAEVFSGGPFHGKRMLCRGSTDGSTLTFSVHGVTGRYDKFEWRYSSVL